MITYQELIGIFSELEKLKGVQRKSTPIGLSRRENSAEHSWQVALLAIVLNKYANDKIDIAKVVFMLLVHDIGEIHTGDKLAYAKDQEIDVNAERSFVRSFFKGTKDAIGLDLYDIWCEFEYGETAEARYARAIDRIPPLIQNLYGEVETTWSAHSVREETVIIFNEQEISPGSASLWEKIKEDIESHFSEGVNA